MVNTSEHKNPYKLAYHAISIMLKMLKILIPLSQYLGPTSANSCLKKTKIKPYIEYTCSLVLKQVFGNCHLPIVPLIVLIKCASHL